jgi:hypothetical protein
MSTNGPALPITCSDARGGFDVDQCRYCDLLFRLSPHRSTANLPIFGRQSVVCFFKSYKTFKEVN